MHRSVGSMATSGSWCALSYCSFLKASSAAGRNGGSSLGKRLRWYSSMNQTPEKSGFGSVAHDRIGFGWCVCGAVAVCANRTSGTATPVRIVARKKWFRNDGKPLTPPSRNSFRSLEALPVEFLPAGQSEADQPHHLRSVFRGRAIHLQRVTRVDHFLLPAHARQHVRAIALDAPLLDAPALILHVHEYEHVRIGPLHALDHALDVDRMLHVIRGTRMMRGDRPGSRNSADQNQRENQPLHHGHTLHFIFYYRIPALFYSA